MTLHEAYALVSENDMAKKLYDYIEHEYIEELVMADIDHDYLTINEGMNGKTYIWYADGVCEGAICIEDGTIIGNTEGILW